MYAVTRILKFNIVTCLQHNNRVYRKLVKYPMAVVRMLEKNLMDEDFTAESPNESFLTMILNTF